MEIQDFVEYLIDSGVPEIAEHILSYLDYKDLKNAELVSKVWHYIIRNGKNWRCCLEKMLSCNPTLRKIYSRYNNEPISTPQRNSVQVKDSIFFKSACHTVMDLHQRLLYSWMTGAQQEEILSPGITISGEKVCIDMSSRYIVIGQIDGKIHVRNRDVTTLEYHHTQELKLEDSQSGIHCMQLDEKNILICGFRSVISFWDIHLGKFLKRFIENENYNIEHLRYGSGALITGSNETHQSRLVRYVCDITNGAQISRKEEILFSSQSIFGLGLDERFIVLLIGKESLFEVQVRLVHDPLILVHSMSYRSHAFCGFYYEKNFIAAGSYDGKIRIWDAETGICKRILLRPSYDSGGPVWLRFNSQFLVTNSLRGINIWNFKEAVSTSLPPYMKLHFCSFQTRSGSSSEQWPFLMDDFEIIRFEHSSIPDLLPYLDGRHRGKSFIVKHNFLND